jgi:hypothetical protein
MRDDQDLNELIRTAAQGDRRAFEDLVVLKRERVVRTAFRSWATWKTPGT